MSMQHTAPQSISQPSSCWVTGRRFPTRVRAYKCDHCTGESIRDRPSGVRKCVAENRVPLSRMRLAGSHIEPVIMEWYLMRVSATHHS